MTQIIKLFSAALDDVSFSRTVTEIHCLQNRYERIGSLFFSLWQHEIVLVGYLVLTLFFVIEFLGVQRFFLLRINHDSIKIVNHILPRIQRRNMAHNAIWS